MPKKKKEEQVELDPEILVEMDETYQLLKDKWFELAVTEKIGYTKDITLRLNKIEEAMEKRKKDIKDGYL